MSKAWLEEHRTWSPYNETYPPADIIFSREHVDDALLFADRAFNNHDFNDGKAVSPYDEGRVDYGIDNLRVNLIQGIDEEQFAKTLRRAIRATNGVPADAPDEETDPTEMLRGGLQTGLETQVVVFEVVGASRVLTHQLVRSRRAAFHQQSQRATWYGDRPNQRWPMSILALDPDIGWGAGVRVKWEQALLACWEAYKAACDAGISYQDARYILPEGTTNYILCEYPLREFIAMFDYRGCSMFQWEMVACARLMRAALLKAHPFLEPYIKISCEKTGKVCQFCNSEGYQDADGVGLSRREFESGNYPDARECPNCSGMGYVGRRCTFQGWENVERQCDFPWAKQDNRVFLPSPRNRIGG